VIDPAELKRVWAKFGVEQFTPKELKTFHLIIRLYAQALKEKANAAKAATRKAGKGKRRQPTDQPPA
jgi:hypothetical protein